MTDTRMAALRGRLPAKHPIPGPYLSSYLLAPLPAPVYPIDVSAGITNWGMFGNGPDVTATLHPAGVGDCTFASLQHYMMAKSAGGADSGPLETSNELVREYLAYNHGKDAGARVADVLLHLYKAGKIFAFAQIDHTNPAEVDSAMAAFHGVYMGVALTANADELFEQDRPWTTSGGQRPDPDDKHCVVKVAADGVEVDRWVTWGAVQKSTQDWTATAVEEAWVIMTPEDAEAAAVNITALRADLDALVGIGAHDPPSCQPIPVSATPPVPPDPGGRDNHVQQALAQIARPGRFMFNPPESMVMGRPVRVEVRLTRSTDLDVELIAGLRGTGTPTVEDIAKTSEFMGVELRGSAFNIQSYSPKDQVVSDGSVTTWEFDVTPLRRGRQPLMLCINMRIQLDAGSDERQSYPVLEREIDVQVNAMAIAQIIGRNWQWFVATFIALAAAIAAWAALVH